MPQDRIQSKAASSLRQSLIVFRMAGLSPFAAVALGILASAGFSPVTAHAQEYPWCMSRESYLYCFYATREQCQGTTSGIGGCALNPRLRFPNKPRDSNARATSRSKDPLSRMN